MTTATTPSRDASGLADALGRLGESRDAEAWALLLERTLPEVTRVARRLCGEAALADDAVQETCLRVRDGAAGFRPRTADPDDDAWRWVMRVAISTSAQLVRTKRRSARRRRPLGERATSSRGPEESHARAERDALLRAALAELDDRYREAVVLHVMEGLPLDEVAAAQRVPVGTVKSRVSRGLDRLRQRLRRGALAPALLLACLRDLPAAEGPPPAGTALHALLASPRRALPPAPPAGTLLGGHLKGWPMASAVVLVAALAVGTVSLMTGAEAAPAAAAAPSPAAAESGPALRAGGIVPIDMAGVWAVDMRGQEETLRPVVEAQHRAIRQALPPDARIDESALEGQLAEMLEVLATMRVAISDEVVRVSVVRKGVGDAHEFRILAATPVADGLSLRVRVPEAKRRRPAPAADEIDLLLTRHGEGIRITMEGSRYDLVRPSAPGDAAPADR